MASIVSTSRAGKAPFFLHTVLARSSSGEKIPPSVDSEPVLATAWISAAQLKFAWGATKGLWIINSVDPGPWVLKFNLFRL